MKPNQTNIPSAEDDAVLGCNSGLAHKTYNEHKDIRPRVMKSVRLNLKPAAEGTCSCVCIDDCSCNGSIW